MLVQPTPPCPRCIPLRLTPSTYSHWLWLCSQSWRLPTRFWSLLRHLCLWRHYWWHCPAQWSLGHTRKRKDENYYEIMINERLTYFPKVSSIWFVSSILLLIFSKYFRYHFLTIGTTDFTRVTCYCLWVSWKRCGCCKNPEVIPEFLSNKH